MASTDTPNHPAAPEPSAIAEPETGQGQAAAKQPSSGSNRPWLIGLGLILLLTGGVLGWRWWQSSRSGADSLAGMPQALPVELDTVQTGPVQEATEFVGNLESRNSVTLRPEIDGRVSQIFVEPGDFVEVGTPLVQLSPEERQAELAGVLASVNSARATRVSARSDLQALEAERASAVAEVELQEQEYRRTATLVQEGALAQQDLDVEDRDRKAAIAELNAITKRIQASQADLAEAEAALQQAQASANLANEELQNARVVAPFAGTVGDIPVKIGDFVETSDELTSVTQNQSLELELAIPIERRSQLRLGTRVELTDAQNKPLGTGQISFISPTVAANAQSILAKAAFNNSQGQLLDRQYVKAKVIWQEGPGVLVPTAAISRLGGQTFVFVAEEPEPAARVSSEEAPPQPEQPTLVAEQRLVELGSLQGNNYQVLEGLQPGERIVTSGILNLSDGVPITPQP